MDSDVQAENFDFQVKFINYYLREIISFTKKIDIRDWGQSSLRIKVNVSVCLCTLMAYIANNMDPDQTVL